jgi:hypothetical protein
VSFSGSLAFAFHLCFAIFIRGAKFQSLGFTVSPTSAAILVASIDQQQRKCTGGDSFVRNKIPSFYNSICLRQGGRIMPEPGRH